MSFMISFSTIRWSYRWAQVIRDAGLWELQLFHGRILFQVSIGW